MTDPVDGASGDRRPARLDRPPGERYALPSSAADPTTGGPRGALITAAIVAAVGGLVLGGLELLDLGAGLIAVAVAVGWLTGLAIRRGTARRGGAMATANARSAMAAGLAGAGVIGGFALVWVWSRLEGGALGPISYLAERFGLLAVALVGLALLAAALRAR